MARAAHGRKRDARRRTEISGLLVEESRRQDRNARELRGQVVDPKDDTPGCTIQGKAFTATKAEFEKRGIHVAGLSADDVASHQGFCTKYSLTVELLADPDARLLKALGVEQSEYKGTMYWNRTTFVVDPKGILRKVYANVNPQGHEDVLLKDIVDLQAS
jgi:thioredoxin-dependent peroxiredoxin